MADKITLQQTLDAMAEYGNPKRDAALSAMDDANGVDPDQYAQDLRLAKQSGLPVDAVQSNKAEIEKDAKTLTLAEKMAILNQAPGTEEFVAKNAKLINDDFSIIGKLKRNFSDLPKSFEDSQETQRLIELNNKDMYGSLTPDEQAERDSIDNMLGEARRGTGGFFSGGLQAAAQNAVQIGRTIVAGGVGGVLGSGLGAAAGAGAGLLGGPFSEVTVPAGSRIGMQWGGRIGGGGAAAYENFSQQSALVFNDLRKVKDVNGVALDRDVARGASIVVGMANAGLDLVGLDKIAENYPGFEKLKAAFTREGIKKALAVPGMKEAFMRIGKTFGVGIGMEGFTEGAQQATQILGEEVAKKVDGGEFGALSFDEAVSDIMANAEGGAGMAFFLGGAGAGMSVAGELRRKRGVMTPSQSQAHIDGINQAVREDKLFQRSPEAFHELVSTLTGDERFYISPDAARNVIGSLSPEQQTALFNAVPDLKTELEGADAGADVAIRKADYATYIAPFAQADMLRDHVKLDPADMTVAEMQAQQAFAKTNPKSAKEIMDQVATLAPDATYQEQVASIERLTRKAMLDAGLSPSEAKANASLYARTMARFSSTFGQNGIDAINRGLLEFQTVDETGKPIRTGSNFSVLLNDLETLNKTGRIPGADENAVNAVKAFGERLAKAELTTGAAKKMSSKELLNRVYPQDQAPSVQIGDATLTMPNVQVGQTPDGGVTVNIAPQQDTSEFDTLNQRYKEPKAMPKSPAAMKDGEPYNGVNSPEFKAWFGDSKVVNEDGSPKVVYHGTANNFDIFETSPDQKPLSAPQSRLGAWFTENPFRASDYAFNTKTMSRDGGNVIPVYLSIQNPYRISREELSQLNMDARSGGDKIDVLRSKLEFDKYDGIIVPSIGGAGGAFVVFNSTQIKSVFNSGAFSPIDPSILKQAEKSLVAVHNLSSENLLHADKMGGLAAPSLAVMKGEHSFDNFGEITLIAPPSLIDPKSNKKSKVFGADAYSPRYPTVSYVVDKKALEPIGKSLSDALDTAGITEDRREMMPKEIEDSGVRAFEKSGAVAARFLIDNNQTLPEKDTFNEGGFYVYGTARRYVEAARKIEGYQKFVSDLAAKVIEKERIFDGFTPSGNRKYIPHTLEKVVNVLTRKLRDGEGFNYGVPSIRSKVAPQFRSIAQIKKAEGRLVSDADFEKIKKDVNDEFDALMEEARNYSPFKNEFGFGDIFSDHVKEIAEGRRSSISILNEYYQNPPEKLVRDIVLFLDKLRNMETEYFEAKIQRAVGINEFSGAVVPVGTRKEVLDALKKNGITHIETYEKGNLQSRIDAVGRFRDSQFFQKERGSISFNPVSGGDFVGRLRSVIVAFTEHRNFSTGAHEFSHWAVAQHRMFAEMARERIAAGDTNPEVKRIADDWEKLKEFAGTENDRFTVDQEEKIARAFEAYMREGRSPSEALRQVFTRFRDWLVKIYKDLTGLDVEIDENIKGVFDRWLASEDEISKVREKNNSLAQIAMNMGLPSDIIDQIADFVNSATSKAEETLYRKMQQEQKRRETKAYKSEFQAMRDKVAEEFGKKREYAAINYVKDSGLKLYVGPDTNAILGEPPQIDTFGNGQLLTHDDIEEIHRAIDEAQSSNETRASIIQALLAPKPKRPRTLIEFLRSKGGVKDIGGNLKAMNPPAGLINNKSGLSPDYAREAAVEAGYIKDAGAESDTIQAQSTTDDLFRSIDSEIGGNIIYSDQDMVEAMAYNDRLALEDMADQIGISQKDIEKARAEQRRYGNYSHLFTTETTTENAVDPDSIAEMFGYDSGVEMIRELRKLPLFSNAVDREARARLSEKYPDMIENGRIHVEALDAIMNDRVLLAIDLLIKEMGRSGAKNTVGMKQFAIQMAQAQVEKMRLSETGYAFRFDVARDREMRLALIESRNGNAEKAMFHLQRAMVNQIVYKNLKEFESFKDRAVELFKVIDMADKKLAPTKDIDFIGAARFILNKYNLGGEDFDIKSWLDDIKERDPDVMNDIVYAAQMVDAPGKNYKDLTIAEFRDVYNSVKNIYETARNMREFEIAGKRVKTDEAVAELIGAMGPANTKINEGTQLTFWQKGRNVISSGKAALRRVELWCKAMDGGQDGPFTKYIWRIINDAENAYKYARDEWMRGYRDILVKHKDVLKERVKIPTGMVKTDALGNQTNLVFRDRMELIGFLLHTGNDSNLDKLLGGYGIERDSFRSEIDRLEKAGVIRKADWEIVQELWNYVEKLKPIAQSAHKKLYGFRFEEIESKPVQTLYGTFRGGYWPAIVDKDQAANNKSVEEMLDETRSYILATTGKGFTKNRNKNYRQPLNTDLRLGSQHIDKVLRFAHLEPAVRDVSRIINRTEFKDNMRARDFDVVDGMLVPWLGRVAQQRMEPPPSMGDRSANMGRKIIRFMQSAAISQLMRYNPVVALQNIANMPVAVHILGVAQFAKSFASITVNPIESIREMRKASMMMNERLTVEGIKASQEIDQFAERKGAFRTANDFALRHGFIFMRALDGYLSAVVWHGGYEKALAEGKGDTDAIAYADSVVRQVMGATGSKDVSKLEASHPVVKAVMPFYSFFNAQANLIGGEFGTIMKKYGWSGTPRMLMAYVMLVAAPAIIGQFVTDSLRDKLPDDDDDGEPLIDWLVWATASQARYASAMVPVAGQMGNALLNRLNNNPMDDRLSISPVISAGDTVLRTVDRTAKVIRGDDVRDSSLIRDAMNSIGFILNVPLGQVSKPISYIVDVQQGETTPDGPLNYMKGLVAGPPPKR